MKKGMADIVAEGFIAVIFIGILVVVGFVMFNFLFGGLTTSEQKAKLALLELSSAIPEGLYDQEYVIREADMNLPKNYKISRTIEDGKLILILEHKEDDIWKEVSRRKTNVKGIQGFAELDGGRIICPDWGGLSGKRFGFKQTYCVLTKEVKDKGVYSFISPSSCIGKVYTEYMTKASKKCISRWGKRNEKEHVPGEDVIEEIETDEGGAVKLGIS